ncbi:hypothetical protein [Nocardia sputi]|uniref:hypothetical protein n=1 Tax=Nocardia sputi TaxID=2943705 RepID=UPI00189519E3|nr:hypothetical protein [Nocardia sputi]UAK31406.1 hypothetical protein K8O92_26980 [Nocardia asteroides]
MTSRDRARTEEKADHATNLELATILYATSLEKPSIWPETPYPNRHSARSPA